MVFEKENEVKVKINDVKVMLEYVENEATTLITLKDNEIKSIDEDYKRTVENLREDVINKKKAVLMKYKRKLDSLLDMKNRYEDILEHKKEYTTQHDKDDFNL